jgi:hypothetical protein
MENIYRNICTRLNKKRNETTTESVKNVIVMCDMNTVRSVHDETTTENVKNVIIMSDMNAMRSVHDMCNMNAMDGGSNG